MRKKALICFLSLLFPCLAFLFMNNNSKANQEEYIRQEYVPNEVLVKFKEDVKKPVIQYALNSVQGRIITYLKDKIDPYQWDPKISSHKSFLLDPRLFHIKVPESIGTEQAIYLLSLNPNVEYAEVNSIYYVCTEPNDPEFERQWALHNIGPEGPAGGTEDADIDAPEAWDIFTGSSDIVVAVIDTGVNILHDDLSANIWINEDEIPYNDIDDDYNGYKDDVWGWDCVNEDEHPLDDNSPYYHGTHVAGIIGAVSNNEKGISGVCWNVKIMVLKAGNDIGEFTTADAIQAIGYAIRNGAHLSNNSWGGYTYSQSLYNAIERAKNAGHLFIAAAANDELPFPAYPAGYDLDNIISVLSTDHNDNLSPFSNYGSYTVDLGAPGGFGWPCDANDIYSTSKDNLYQYLYGTSMATPHVSGVAALIWGKPVQIWWDQVKEIILESVDDNSSLHDKCLTEGRLNAYNALYEPAVPVAPSNLAANSSSWNHVDLSWQDNSDNEIGFHIRRKLEGSEYISVGAAKENLTSFQDSTATGGVTLYYSVAAYTLGQESSWCTTIYTIPGGIPAAPTGLDADCLSEAEGVDLTWIDNSNNEQGFKIERKSETQPNWEQIDIVGGNVTTYNDADVNEDTIYWYRLRAYNPDGNSTYSNVVDILVPEEEEEDPDWRKN